MYKEMGTDTQAISITENEKQAENGFWVLSTKTFWDDFSLRGAQTQKISAVGWEAVRCLMDKCCSMSGPSCYSLLLQTKVYDHSKVPCLFSISPTKEHKHMQNSLMCSLLLRSFDQKLIVINLRWCWTKEVLIWYNNMITLKEAGYSSDQWI